MKPIKISQRRDYQRALAQYLAREDIQAYTMAVLSFFALAFFSIFAIRPTLISFFNLQKQIDDAVYVEEQLDNKINALLKAQETYQQYQAEIGLLDSALPAEPKFPELLKKMETIVMDQEATISAFTTDKFSLLKKELPQQSDREDLSSVDFSVTIEPTYLQAESALKKLMNLRRVILLTFLGVEVKDRGTSDEKVQTTTDGSAYYLFSPE
jgi:hypothetical protein